MSNCPPEDVLEQRLAGQLSAQESGQIDQHIERCAACQAALDRLTDSATDPLLPQRATETSKPASQDEDAALAALMAELVRHPPSEIDLATAALDFSARDTSTPDNSDSGASAAPLPLDTIGSYRIVKQLNHGSTGMLYVARDESLNRTVAIKVLRGEHAHSEQAQRRLLREARAAGSLKHDHIVHIYEVGQQPDSTPYIVMEYVDGESVAADGVIYAGLALDFGYTLLPVRQAN